MPSANMFGASRVSNNLRRGTRARHVCTRYTTSTPRYRFTSDKSPPSIARIMPVTSAADGSRNGLSLSRAADFVKGCDALLIAAQLNTKCAVARAHNFANADFNRAAAGSRA